jgi:hypothetical protein
MNAAGRRATSPNERALHVGILKQSGRILNIGIVKNCKRKAAFKDDDEKHRAKE